MLTTEENDVLTRVGPGTPCGELLRRYWQPVGMLSELSEETPTKFVRTMGEDLVLFRDKTGRVGLIADHCSHRGASLLHGRVEQRGIACAYHGWLYDTEGKCLETPAEPADSNFYRTVQHKAYPVREYSGLYWAYLGPPPAPVLPRYDVLEDLPIRRVGQVVRLDCNWLQFVEQNVDQAHVLILHQNTGQIQDVSTKATTRGNIDDLVSVEYSEVPFGIKRRQVRRNGYEDTDIVLFPATLRLYNQLSVKVPIDDTHTRQYHVSVDLGQSGAPMTHSFNGPSGEIEYATEHASDAKTPPDAIHPFAKYRMDKLRFQDFMALESQGPIAARESEHLGTSDRGIMLLRTILLREIEKVQQGLDPIGVIRDPDHAPLSTYVENYLAMVRKFPARAS